MSTMPATIAAYALASDHATGAIVRAAWAALLHSDSASEMRAHRDAVAELPPCEATRQLLGFLNWRAAELGFYEFEAGPRLVGGSE